MLSPRWRKLVRDVQLTAARVAMMVLAIAAGVCGLATMLSSYSILERETTRNYRATNPPSATLTIPGLDPAMVAQVRRFPGIAEAEAGATVGALLRTASGEVLPLTIFVVGDFTAMRINTVYREAGAWPPVAGTLLLERDALTLAGASIGGHVTVQVPGGVRTTVTVGGTLHDPALPPASRGQTVYAYATPATVAALGLDGSLRNLKLTVSEHPYEVAAIEATVAKLALWLRERGYPVQRIRIPPPGEHPHQRIMNAIMVMLLIFSGIALVLSAVLCATILGGMLAQQTRQIGVMKTIGARNGQIAALYLTLVLVLSVAATALGGFAGLAAGRAFAGTVLTQLLNFSMESTALPLADYALLLVAGILMPLAVASVPILQATRMTVHAAIGNAGSASQHYSGAGRLLDGLPFVSRSLLMALRNTLRRRGRLVLTVTLLSMAGAMYVSSLNVRKAAQQHLIDGAADRRHDLELVLAKPADSARVMALIGAAPGVARVEPWPRAAATPARGDGLEIERTYPDGDHGTLGIAAVPEATGMLKLHMLEGRWLLPGEVNAVVLNNTAALNFFSDAKVGEEIALSSHGRSARLRLVGIARQYMSPAIAFMPRPAYARFGAQGGLAGVYRVVMEAHDDKSIAAITRRIEAALAQDGIEVRLSTTETMMRKDVDGHFDLMIAALLFISVLMALVGAFGLGSAMGSNVAERSREFGIMRSIGATTGIIMRNILAEGAFVGLMSVPVAIALALPLSAAIGAFLGNLLFGLPFPFALSLQAVLTWLALVLGGALLASGWPAWKAARVSIHQSLTQI